MLMLCFDMVHKFDTKILLPYPIGVYSLPVLVTSVYVVCQDHVVYEESIKKAYFLSDW